MKAEMHILFFHPFLLKLAIPLAAYLFQWSPIYGNILIADG
jgi:hypothetical protein